MFCTRCGQQIPEGAALCPACGMPTDEQTGTPVIVPTVTASDRLKPLFANGIMLAIAILLSIATLLPLVNGQIEIFNILFTIAAWMVYATACQQAEITQTGLAMISGTVKAIKIVMWISVGFCAVGGLICILAGVSVGSVDFADLFVSGLDEMDLTVHYGGESRDLYELLGYISLSAFFNLLGVIMLMTAGICVVLNIFFYQKLHRVTKSICILREGGEYCPGPLSAVRTWMIVLGVLSALGSISSLASDFSLGIAALCTTALYFLGAKMCTKVQQVLQ